MSSAKRLGQRSRTQLPPGTPGDGRHWPARAVQSRLADLAGRHVNIHNAPSWRARRGVLLAGAYRLPKKGQRGAFLLPRGQARPGGRLKGLNSCLRLTRIALIASAALHPRSWEPKGAGKERRIKAALCFCCFCAAAGIRV